MLICGVPGNALRPGAVCTPSQSELKPFPVHQGEGGEGPVSQIGSEPQKARRTVTAGLEYRTGVLAD